MNIERELIGGAYDKCLSCSYLGNACDGPNTLSMTLERWCEWCSHLKRIRGYTNTYIADKAEVSLKTVERIINVDPPKDIRRATAAAITKVLVGSAGQWPCAAVLEAEAPTAIRELEERNIELIRLRETLQGIHESYQQELAKVREEAQVKIDFLKLENDRKDKIINRLLDKD